jgi:hypothetical protein
MQDYKFSEVGNALKPTHTLCSKCGQVKLAHEFRYKKLNYGRVSNYFTWVDGLWCASCRIRKTPVYPSEYKDKLHRRGLPNVVVDMLTANRIQRGKKQKTDTWRKTIANQLKPKYDKSLKGLCLEQGRVNANIYRATNAEIKDFLLRYKDILSLAKKSARQAQREAKQPRIEWHEYITEEQKKLLCEKHDELHQRLDMSKVRPSWISI